MKKILFIAFFILATAIPAGAQVYKMDNVYEMGYESILSYMRVIEGEGSGEHTFLLWGHQYYGEDANTAYEADYYRAGAVEMYTFLRSALDFTVKYRETDRVLTYISGVKLRTIKTMGFRYTLIFDKEGKVCCRMTEKYLEQMLASFVRFCTENGIIYS